MDAMKATKNSVAFWRRFGTSTRRTLRCGKRGASLVARLLLDFQISVVCPNASRAFQYQIACALASGYRCTLGNPSNPWVSFAPSTLCLL